MSIKTDYLLKIATSTTLIALVATTIIFSNGPAAVSQQPPSAPPLSGGFKIDYGDEEDAADSNSTGIDKRDSRTADEIVRSLMKADAARGIGTESEIPEPKTGSNPSPVADSVAVLPRPSSTSPAIQPQNVPAESTVPGLPSTALPMAFPAAAPPPGSSKGPATLIQAGDMIGFSRELGDGVQAITIINASRRWMAVYHIDTSGQIRLTSSRPLDADFTIQFNATAPLPEDIRRLQGK